MLLKRKGFRVVVGLLLSLIIVCVGYCLVAFSNIPILSDMRVIWIETAMTTADHQWLATKLFPQSVIDEVMSHKIEDTGEVSVTVIKKVGLNESTGIKYDLSILENKVGSLIEADRILEEEQKNKIVFSDDDEFGNKVIVNDKEQGIKIVEVKTVSYTGRIVFIDDPSRVFIANTNRKGTRGELILNYLKK